MCAILVILLLTFPVMLCVTPLLGAVAPGLLAMVVVGLCAIIVRLLSTD